MDFTMFKIVKFFLIFLLLIGSFVNAKTDLPEYEKYVDAIVKAFAKEMKEELGLECEGDGGRMPNDVEEIKVYFVVNRRVTIEEARKLQIYTSEKLLRAINAHEKIRPFLREYPFTPKRVEIHISYKNEYIGPFADGTPSYVSTIKGNIYYDASDAYTQKLKEILKEPYEEAIKIAPINSLTSDDLKIHCGPLYEKCVDKLLYDFSKEAYDKWGLYCCTFGGKTVNGIEELAIKFVALKPTSLENARALYIAVTERFNEVINSELVLRADLKEYPFPIRRTKVQISFKDKKGRHYEDGTVAYVNQENDMLYYFTELPLINNHKPVRPVPLAEERYEDAKKIVQTPTSKPIRD